MFYIFIFLSTKYFISPLSNLYNFFDILNSTLAFSISLFTLFFVLSQNSHTQKMKNQHDA
jgi:hypothetical protein